MARTLIRNISGDDLTLPLPYTGVLLGGDATVVADSAAEVTAFLGGADAVRNVWQITEVSDGNPLGPYQRSTAAGHIAESLAKLEVPLSVNGQRVTNVGAPSAGSDAATKQYVDSQVGGGAITPLSGSVQPPAGAGPFAAGTPVGISTATGAVVACDALNPATFPCIGIWTTDDFIRIGGVEVNGQRVTNVGAPSAGSDAATKQYVDSQVGGGAISGYAAGALLYVAEGGGLTATRPATPGAVAQQVASGLAGGASIFVVPGGLQVIV